ncbi:MAG: hypothetical protein KA712_00140 [Myxococcales bacterium]|nr:hypothetical protein [Myxococcales bacterium]
MRQPLVDKAMMDVVRREQGKPAVVVLSVVLGEKFPQKLARVLDRRESFGKGWSVLQCLELSLREGVIIMSSGAAYCGVARLSASLTNLGVGAENTTHRSFGAEILALIEERGKHLDWRQIAESQLIQRREHLFSFSHG